MSRQCPRSKVEQEESMWSVEGRRMFFRRNELQPRLFLPDPGTTSLKTFSTKGTLSQQHIHKTLTSIALLCCLDHRPKELLAVEKSFYLRNCQTLCTGPLPSPHSPFSTPRSILNLLLPAWANASISKSLVLCNWGLLKPRSAALSVL